MKPKVALFANTSWYLYNFRRDLIVQLQHEGYEVVLMAPPDRYSEKLSEISTYQPIENLRPRSMNPVRDLILLLEIVNKVRQLKIEILMLFTIKPNLYGSLAAKMCRIPSIVSITGLGETFNNAGGVVNALVRKFYSWGLRFSDHFVFQNSEDFDVMRKYNLVGDDDCTFTPGSGVNLEKFSFKPATYGNKTKFILASRLLHEKGILEYVEAGKRVRQAGYEIELALAGELDEGNPSSITREQLDHWCEEDYFEYLGMVDDVRPAIHAANAAVLPSYYREGVPKFLIEALALGRPIITTDWIGCRDTVELGKNGYLVKPRDSQSLAEAMLDFINLSEEEKFRMSSLSREKAEREFDVKLVIDRYLNVISSLDNN